MNRSNRHVEIAMEQPGQATVNVYQDDQLWMSALADQNGDALSAVLYQAVLCIAKQQGEYLDLQQRNAKQLDEYLDLKEHSSSIDRERADLLLRLHHIERCANRHSVTEPAPSVLLRAIDVAPTDNQEDA